jgi:uridine kinase
MDGTYIAAVGGDTSAGKSTLAPALRDILIAGHKKHGNGDLSVGVLPMDLFYRDLRVLGFSTEERNALELGLDITPELAAKLGIEPGELPFSFDHIDIFEWDLYREAVASGRARKPISRPRYDFSIHGYPDQPEMFELPGDLDILIPEGLHVVDQARGDYDFAAFVDAPESERYRRREARDIAVRGRTVAQVRAQMDATVIPASRAFVRPTKEDAHVTVYWHVEGEDDLQRQKAILVANIVEQIANPVYKATTGLELPDVDTSDIHIGYFDDS